jgi:hypothetical protein
LFKPVDHGINSDRKVTELTLPGRHREPLLQVPGSDAVGDAGNTVHDLAVFFGDKHAAADAHNKQDWYNNENIFEKIVQGLLNTLNVGCYLNFVFCTIGLSKFFTVIDKRARAANVQKVNEMPPAVFKRRGGKFAIINRLKINFTVFGKNTEKYRIELSVQIVYFIYPAGLLQIILMALYYIDEFQGFILEYFIHLLEEVVPDAVKKERAEHEGQDKKYGCIVEGEFNVQPFPEITPDL